MINDDARTQTQGDAALRKLLIILMLSAIAMAYIQPLPKGSVRKVYNKLSLLENMNIKLIPKNQLLMADEFQERILNPKNKKRYRTFADIKKCYLKNPSLFVSAFDKTQIIGIVFGYVKRKNVLLGEMAIDKNYLGLGLGSTLLDFFEKQVVKLRKNKIVLGSRENAEGFYLKRGYNPILFLQIRHSDVPNNYELLTKHKIQKETNYSDAKRLFIKVKHPSDILKRKLIKIFCAYNGIYLFEKTL